MFFFIVLLFQVTVSEIAAPNCTFRFSNTLGNHMVLQQAPYRAKIWGFAPASMTVTVSYGSNNPKITTKTDANCVWQVSLEPQKASTTPYTVTAAIPSSDANSQIQLSDVLFGDVWLCGGQSNMEFAINQVFNSSQEIAAADKYPHIRLFTPSLEQSDTPVDQLKGILQPWSVASSKTVTDGKSFSYFSAVCWLFGKQLYDEMKYPVGLIASNWGGTPVRAWSSPTVTKACNETIGESLEEKLVSQQQRVDRLHGPSTDSILWNAMIVPFLKTTIYGAIWYQGEADSRTGYDEKYACCFPGMIDDWRKQFNANSGTDAVFPFGFVQLAAWNDQHAQADCGDDANCVIVPIVRWGQTANYGYVPNPKMKRVFMGTAIDLGDPTSPYGDVHPRYKQQVAARLFADGLKVAYNKTGIYSLGPYASKVTRKNATTLEIMFDNVGEPLKMKNTSEFEVFAAGHWMSTKLLGVQGSSAIVGYVSDTKSVTKIRYLWKQAPCHPRTGILDCAVYSGTYPALPFIADVQ